MAASPPPPTNPSTRKRPSRIRSFFSRIRSFLTGKQAARVEKQYKESVKEPIPPYRPPQASASPGPAASGAPQERGRAAPAGAARAPAPTDAAERGRRIEELRLIEEEARLEREQIEEKVAAQAPPEKGTDQFNGPRTGFNYHSWLKAFATFGELRDMGDSPTLLGEMEELEDMDVPAAFHSGAKLGKVKWKGIQEREALIEKVNAAIMPAGAADFRDVYPQWEYVYKITESVGDVVVQEFVHKARKPYNQAAKAQGYKSR